MIRTINAVPPKFSGILQMRTLLLASVLSLLVLVGCKHDSNKIVGQWQGTMSGSGMSAATTAEFKADNGYTIETAANGYDIKQIGTYKLDTGANTILLTPTSVEVNGKLTKMDPKAQAAVSHPQTMTWSGDSEMTINLGSGSVHFKRK
jgi:hypothetical protein